MRDCPAAGAEDLMYHSYVGHLAADVARILTSISSGLCVIGVSACMYTGDLVSTFGEMS